MRFQFWKRFGAALCLGFVALSIASCEGSNFTLFGYTTKPNYRTDIHTVRVKVCKNSTYRQGIEFDLTRAIIQQIEWKTPYKVVRGDQPADTEITANIKTQTKADLTVNDVDEQRDIDTTLAVEVVWRDLRDGKILSRPPRRFGEPTVDVVPVPVAPGPLTAPTTPGMPTPVLIATPMGPGVNAKPGPNDSVLITVSQNYAPETGMSTLTALTTATQKAAIAITQLMEIGW